MMFSLIVATVNRVAELERLLCSLDQQTFRDFEVIIIDQNDDDRLVPVISAYQNLTVKHLRCERGLSRARNAGLRASVGDLIAIPDDDCWYTSQLLEQVHEWFAAHDGYDALSTCVRSADGSAIGPNWPKDPCDVTIANVFRSGISCGIFFRRQVYEAVGEFNEDIGVGAPTMFQSGEETDYVLRMLNKEFRLRFEPSIAVYHPQMKSIERLRRVTFSYALGSGYVLRAHGFPLRLILTELIRSCGGALVSLLRGRFSTAHVYILRAAGQFAGYIAAPSQPHSQN